MLENGFKINFHYIQQMVLDEYYVHNKMLLLLCVCSNNYI